MPKGYGGDELSEEDMAVVKRALSGPNGPKQHDQSRGLNPDFRDDAVCGRVLGQISGLSPHERPGHLAPKQPIIKHEPAEDGVEAVRNPNLNDGIERT